MNLNQPHTHIRFRFGQLLRLLLIRRNLRKRDRWTRAELLLHQKQALMELQTHAYTNSPFYRRFHAGLQNKPLHELPVLTKKELMENWNDIVTDQTLKIDDLRKFVEEEFPDSPLLYHGEYIVSTTSGTTGLKGIFAFNKHEWLWGLASHGRATEWAKARVIGLFHKPKMATVSSRKPWCKSLLVSASVDSPLLSSLRLDSIEPLHVISEKLKKFKPEILVAYAETARALAQRQTTGSLGISPKTVLTSSEILTSQSKETIKRAWGSIPFNAYASTETALLAADCEHHHMHLCEDLAIVEIVDKNNQPVPSGVFGEKILVTVLFSRTIPLIRYEISDCVAFANPELTCTCGKPFAILADIQGRTEDTIHLANTNNIMVAIKPDVFHDVLEPAPINGWQVVQKNKTDIVVSIVGPQSGFDGQELLDKLRNSLKEQGVENPVVHLEVIEKLPQSPSGKTPLVKALRYDQISKSEIG